MPVVKNIFDCICLKPLKDEQTVFKCIVCQCSMHDECIKQIINV